ARSRRNSGARSGGRSTAGAASFERSSSKRWQLEDAAQHGALPLAHSSITFTRLAMIAPLAGLALGLVMTAPAQSQFEKYQEPACVEHLLKQKQNAEGGAQTDENADSTDIAARSADLDGDGTISREEAKQSCSSGGIDGRKDAGVEQDKS
ncbi:MAG: hypothetical protein AAGJ70_11355, partial [Pseudomonadota bacterium]